MEKILLIGKLDQTSEILYKQMNKDFQIQFCTEFSKIMQNMIRIVQPDMLLVNIVDNYDMSDIDVEDIAIMYSNIPIVIVAEKEIFDKYSFLGNRDNIYCVQRPILANTIVAKCRAIFGKEETATPHIEKEDITHRKSILVVDDGAITLRSVKALLDGKYNVSVATSGEMALKKLEREIPDLILLDYEMPGLDGKETLEKIRADENIKNIPVIFLTGVADRQNIANVLHLNPMGYILKPPSQDKLFEAIEEALK